MFGSRWLPQTTCADRAPPEVQAIFFRRHHQPRRRPLVCALDSGTGDGLRAGVLAALFPVLRPVREQEAKLLKALLHPVAEFLLAQPVEVACESKGAVGNCSRGGS